MNLDHVFIELALTDTNISLASVCGMAAVRTDRKGKVIAAYSQSIAVRSVLDESALQDVYGSMSDALLRPYPSEYVLIAQHAGIYKAILGPDYFKGKPWLDIAQLAWPLGYCDMVSNRDLDTLCKHFGITAEAPGTMTGNCEALVRVYWALMKRYRTALLGEEAIRDIGGEALASVRKFVGF